MLKILLTGFESFGGEEENSSWAVAEKAAAFGVVGGEVVAERLPVSFTRGTAALQSAVELHHPDIVLLLGQTSHTDCVRLERVALNMMDSNKGDNDGYNPTEEPIVKGGESAFFTPLPIKSLCAAIKREGIAVKISNSAGLYVCNCLYYEALRICGACEQMRALFVHLPHYEGQPTQNIEYPTMPLNDMVRAVEIIIEEINEQNQRV